MAPKKPSEDLDMDQLAEAELSRLQRQYHIMEGDRRSYSQEANVILQRQRFADILNMLSIFDLLTLFMLLMEKGRLGDGTQTTSSVSASSIIAD
jgi:hypothetical protein